MDLSVYRVRLRALGSIRLDKFPGIPLEGALTGGVREVSCACSADAAPGDCPIGHHCAYHLLARPTADLFDSLPKRYGTPPPPLVLRPRFPPGTYSPGSELELQVVLAGRAQEHFRWVLAGLVAAGRRGVGPIRNGSREDGRFEVGRIEAVGPEATLALSGGIRPESLPRAWRYPDDFSGPAHPGSFSDTFTVELRSPTLIEKKGFSRGTLEFSDLIGSLGKRVSLLSTGYGTGNLVDYTEHMRLKGLADEVTLDAKACEWREW
ncbi:MAG TPA: hypothetical protein VFQ76_13075, partial [Longimicrobiaceae bacterium]|nr:hypothetical protein [Longimicrobiaceae bacterium]